MRLSTSEIRKNKLEAINKRNKLSKILIKNLIEFLKKYEGESIFKIDGSLKKKYKNEYDDIMKITKNKKYSTIRAYSHLEYGYFKLTIDIHYIVDIYETGGHGVNYAHKNYYLCEYKKDKIENIKDDIKIKTYTLKNYEKAQEKINYKNLQIEKLQNEINIIKSNYSDLMYE